MAASRVSSRRDSLLLAACVGLSVVARAMPDRVREPIAAGMRESLVAPLLSLQHNAELTRRAWEARERTVAAHDSVVLRAMGYSELERENERLRHVLGLGQRLRWGFVPVEALFGRGRGEEHTVVLSAGANRGVRRYSPVVAPEGLVGMVTTVDRSMSIAIVWPHPDFRVSAQAEDGSAFGIVAGHLGDEPDHYLLEMRGVPLRNTLRTGTLVVSSGLGGVYPRGIPIGVVQKELQTSEVWARTYLLRPAVLPADISNVMILQPQRTAAGLEEVWRRPADSLRRLAVEADSAARRADSVRVDSARVRPRPPTVARRDTAARRDTTARRASVARRDTARPAPPRVDTVRRDSARRDTTPSDTARPAPVPPPRPDTVPPTPPDTGGRP